MTEAGEVTRCDAASAMTATTTQAVNVAQEQQQQAGDNDNNTPVIADAVQYKYYRVPDGMRRLRNKHKVALVFAYNGERYCGLQWNRRADSVTVEAALLRALYETDMISDINFCNGRVCQLLNYERASRTDKGVHALCNVASVSVMLPYSAAYVARQRARMATTTVERDAADKDDAADAADADDDDDDDETDKYSCEEAKRLLNTALPDDIHVYAVVPVTRSFNAYLCCSGRRYEYYLPTFALMSRDDYVATYFAAALAPAQPTVEETGYVARVRMARGVVVAADNNNSDDEQQQHEEEEEADVSEEKTSAAAGGSSSSSSGAPRCVVAAVRTSGRKNKGHFPKRRNKRRKLQQEQEQTMTTTKRRHDGDDDEATTSSVCAACTDDNNNEEDKDDDKATTTTAAQPSSSSSPHDSEGAFATMMLFRSVPEEAMRRVAQYRLPHAQLARVRAAFAQYEGTHCYHNFTPGGLSSDASCHRFVRRVRVSEPRVVYPSDARIAASLAAWSPSHCYTPDAPSTADTADNNNDNSSSSDEEARREAMRAHMQRVYGASGIEVVCIELDGQSFMLNQIRKMVGAVVCMMACELPVTYLRDTLLRRGVRCGVPMAPANGLLLAYLSFATYNQRLARIQRNGNNGRGKPPVDLDVLASATATRDEVAEQREALLAVMLRNEMARDLMGAWMRSLRHVVRLTWCIDLP